MYVCVCVASIVLWIDLWKLVCSPFGQIVKPSGYHRGTEPVWIQARDSGALQPFDRISRKQVGVELFATVFWKTKRDGVEDSTHRLHMFMIYKHTHGGRQIAFYHAGQTCLDPMLFTTG